MNIILICFLIIQITFLIKKNLNNKEKNITPSYFEHDDNISNSCIGIANGLNNYFVHITRTLLLSLITESGSFYDFDSFFRRLPSQDNYFYFQQVYNDDFANTINYLKMLLVVDRIIYQIRKLNILKNLF